MKDEQKTTMVTAIKDFHDAVAAANKTCLDFIKDFLNEIGGHYDVRQVANETCDGMEVTYDGGNHPEYASGILNVESIYLDERGNPCFELEYVGNGYECERAPTADLIFVCDYILEHQYNVNVYND